MGVETYCVIFMVLGVGGMSGGRVPEGGKQRGLKRRHFTVAVRQILIGLLERLVHPFQEKGLPSGLGFGSFQAGSRFEQLIAQEIAFVADSRHRRIFDGLSQGDSFPFDGLPFVSFRRQRFHGFPAAGFPDGNRVAQRRFAFFQCGGHCREFFLEVCQARQVGSISRADAVGEHMDFAVDVPQQVGRRVRMGHQRPKRTGNVTCLGAFPPHPA